ncbi:hypothetical protein D477_011616 [Arthrobacter crystallopoietes BAB-32]|uniref:Uncharacterized protein n=1 Tax=Arthrobacter crystallopoietes BAB-32 TaxID=1246476 RepID=N1V233_9MICC|nr:hypothetical protein D477_011616 [Arthrobacter crystallopoietes BAB-32]
MSGPPQYIQPVYAQPAPAPWYPQVPAKPPVSGLRVTSGILVIIFSLLQSVMGVAGLNYDFDGESAFLGLASWGMLYAGIMLLVKSRSTTPTAPTVGLAFLGVLLGVLVPHFAVAEVRDFFGSLVLFVIWAAPAGLLIATLVRERRSRPAPLS